MELSTLWLLLTAWVPSSLIVALVLSRMIKG